MTLRPPIQAVIETQAELDSKRRNWRMVLFNPDGSPFSGGSGGGGGGAQTIELDDVASYTFSDLNGDAAVAYEVEYAGIFANPGNPGALDAFIRMVPNGESGGSWVSGRHAGYVAGDGSPATSANADTSNTGPGWPIGGSVFGGSGFKDASVTGRAIIHTKAGSQRGVQATGAWANFGNAERAHVAYFGKWTDSTTVIDELTIDFGGATFTGVVTLKPLVNY